MPLLIDQQFVGGASCIATAEREFGAFENDPSGVVRKLGRVTDNLRARILVPDITSQVQRTFVWIEYRTVRTRQFVAATQHYAAGH